MTRSATRTLLVWACAGWLGCGVAVPDKRPTTPPEVATPRTAAAPENVERTTNGVSIVRVPGSPGSFRALLVLAAGPADDPVAAPGLTDLAVSMALEGTAHHPDARPAQRARVLGGELDVVSDGSMSGWAVTGPLDSAQELLSVLTDVLVTPTFPSTRVAAVAERTRESVELRDNALIMTAIAVASGVALGRGRPLRLQPTPPQLSRLNRETVVRHWLRLVDPKRLALVVAGDGPQVDAAVATARSRLAQLPTPKPSDAPSFSSCQPSRRSSHLIMNPGSGTSQMFTIIALPAPGRSDPSRAALETAIAALATSPTGIIARKIGPERAFHAVPRLLDLGYSDGRGAAILLMRVSGPRTTALRELFTVLEVLVEFGKAPPRGASLDAARHNAASSRLHAREGLIASLVEAAGGALYPSKRAPVPWGDAVPDIFDPSSVVVVGVGPADFALVYKRIGPLTVWNSVGQPVGGDKPPGCKRRAL